MKEAWDSKRDVLVRSGAFAIEQLSEALSSSARSNKISDGLPQKAVRECANQVTCLENVFFWSVLFLCILKKPFSTFVGIVIEAMACIKNHNQQNEERQK